MSLSEVNTRLPELVAHVAAAIRSVHPDIAQLIKSAFRPIAADPDCGEPLQRELDRLRKYRVRIVFAVQQNTRVIRLMASGHRQFVYEELTEHIRRKSKEWKNLRIQKTYLLGKQWCQYGKKVLVHPPKYSALWGHTSFHPD